MKKLKVAPGDVVEVPVGNDESILCRVISEENVSAHLVEFFSRKYKGPVKKIDGADLGPRLFRPVFMNFLFFTIPKWKIVRSDPDYTPDESDYDNIEIAFDASATPMLWKGGNLLPAKKEALKGLETSIAWIPDRLVRRISDHLAEKFKPNDEYPV